MRCVNCGTNITGGKKKGFPSHCPGCGHKTVTRPRESGFADRQVQMAIDRVSVDGMVYFLREHVAWELLRMLRHRRLNKRWIGIGILLAAAVAATVVAVSGVSRGIVISTGILMVAIVLAFTLRSGKYPNVLDLVDEFLTVNPSPRQIRTGGHIGRGVNGEDSAGDQPDPVATGRVLVCDRRDYADFYRANNFEMQAACAVVHGGNRPSGGDAETVARLKNAAGVEVFLVHDLTPGGQAMAENIRESSHWFAGRTNVTIHDLGINGDQIDMLDKQWRPLDTIPGGGGEGMRIQGLPRGQGAELAVFRPQRLLKMTWACVEQQQPFHKVDPRRAGTDDGAAGGGG